MGGRKHFKKGGGTFISEFQENKGGNTQSQLIFQLWHQYKKDQSNQMPKVAKILMPNVAKIQMPNVAKIQMPKVAKILMPNVAKNSNAQ